MRIPHPMYFLKVNELWLVPAERDGRTQPAVKKVSIVATATLAKWRRWFDDWAGAVH
jgi:hypothetical protein